MMQVGRIERGAHPQQPDGGREQTGRDEGGAPAGGVGQEGGHDRGQGDPQVAEYAVHADRPARFVAGGLHQHCGPDRVVDRGETSGERQGYGQHGGGTGETGADQASGDAQEERAHQDLAAEALRQPALRQRQQAVEHEHAGGEGQDRAIRLAERAAGNRHRQHGGGQDQQAIVGDRVGGVDEHDLPRNWGHG
jgi:hypothetical protein